MDAGFLRFSGRSRRPASRHHDNLDRFIPNRSAMDLDYAHYAVTKTRKKVEKDITRPTSPWRLSYRDRLAEACNLDRPRILAFKNKPPLTPPTIKKEEDELPLSSSLYLKRAMRMRSTPHSAERTLDVLDIVDDYSLNLLDWGGADNTLAVGLQNRVYLWNPESITELVSADDDDDNGPVTSVKWAPDRLHVAVGFNNAEVELWDATTGKLVRTLRGGHEARVGSLDWNNNILTTGSKDTLIINNDVRLRSHVVETYRGHDEEVCGLKWSTSGELASGGNDNLVFIWNLNSNQRLHCFSEHTAPVKALAWCPFQTNLLASGGGEEDHCIKFWNTKTGKCLNTVDMGSQVSSLLWNRHERELLTSHGNELTLLEYPYMAKLKQLCGHSSRVLQMSASPDGYQVASVGADEKMPIWQVFGTPKLVKPTRNTETEPFASFARIR